jgi:hypothetical protein
MPPLLRFIKRAHRILTRMGIPELGYDSEENMYDKNLEILLERLKTVQLYQNAVRGKWLREKKKAAAANRELEAFRQGNKKTWQTKADHRPRHLPHRPLQPAVRQRLGGRAEAERRGQRGETRPAQRRAAAARLGAAP